MTKFFLAAGVAALAIAAPAAADRGDKDRGGKAKASKVERGGGKMAKARGRDRDSKVVIKSRGRDNDRRFAKMDRKDDRMDRKEVRKDLRVVNRADRHDDDRFDDDRFDRRFARGKGFARGRFEDCPPGLDKRDNGCLPPGQAKRIGTLIPAAYRSRVVPRSLRDLYRDNDNYYYRVGDRYMYRVDRKTNLIASLLPLLGGGLVTGQMFPSAYNNAYVPRQYQAFYRDTPDDYYRYANGYVYEIDRSSGLIESMIPLMAGGYGMGQMLPASYSTYNLPYQYRSFYTDNNDHMYRYAPGAIYQVDPSTRLITAVASLLTGNGLSVGQPLPMGYNAYNVPLGYRDQYADTSDAWYRYNNGNIYQVDPTTQVVTALIRALV